jgi:hypothetical protein
VIRGLVSTIIPVFNRPMLLREAVDSVLAQSHRPIEIVIVDDGSTDDTVQVAESLCGEHDFIHLVQQRNAGPGAARNAGLRIARGEYVQFLDSDDVLEPTKLAAQVAALERDPEAGVAYGWTRLRWEDGTLEPRPWKRSGEVIETIFPSMIASRWWDTSNPLYRRTLIDRAGDYLPMRMEEDWEFDCRIGALGVRLAYCPQWMCEVRVQPARLSGSWSAAVLADRATAELAIADHAERAGVARETPELQHLARGLFLLARQCGAAGLTAQSRALTRRSAELTGAKDARIYALVAPIIGWRTAGGFSEWFDRTRAQLRTRSTERRQPLSGRAE